MAKQKTINAFVSCWTQTFGLLDIEHELIGDTTISVAGQTTLKESIWHSLEHEKQTFMNYGHTWRINKLPLEPTSNFQAPESPFFFSDEHPWGSEPFLGNLLVSKESYCCLVDHGDQDQSPTPHPSETAKKTPANPMVSSRGIGSSRKQQSGETTPLTQYRSGRVSPDKAETSQRNWRRKQL